MRAVLIGLSSKPWLNSSKIAQHISQAWEGVVAICSEESSLNNTMFISVTHKITRNADNLVNKLEEILEDEDFVVPTDHDAINYIQCIISKCSQRVQKIVWKSIGKSATLGPRVDKKELYEFIQTKKLAVTMPAQWKAFSDVQKLDGKVVIKSDNNYGGEGTIIISYSELPNHTLPPDSFLQEYIEGEKFIHCCACLEGRVLDSITIKVLKSAGATGPMRVGKQWNMPDISEAASNLIRGLNFTGFCDLDFISNTTGSYLLDFNARPTYHSLSILNGRHMAQILVTQLHPERTFETKIRIANPNVQVVTLMEFMIDQSSPLLSNSEGFLDFCFEDLPFLKTLIDYLLVKKGNSVSTQ